MVGRHYNYSLWFKIHIHNKDNILVVLVACTEGISEKAPLQNSGTAMHLSTHPKQLASLKANI